MSHINSRGHRWVNSGSDRKGSGPSAPTGDWPASNGWRRPPAGDAVRPPAAPSFHVTLRGPLCDLVRAIVGEYDLGDGAHESVLTDLRLDDDELESLLGRAGALGLEIVQVRRLTGS